MRIISIVGLKNTGKTSLTGKIIKELTNRNFKVASIKHSHHRMEMDHEGTDTYKQMEAGSDFVVGIGGRTYFNINERLDLERILFLIKLMENPDFVVIEGFKAYPYAKIATCEEGIHLKSQMTSYWNWLTLLKKGPMIFWKHCLSMNADIMMQVL